MKELTVRLSRPHKAQKEILDGRKRFNVIKCGRRFGKTHLVNKLTEELLRPDFIVDGKRTGGYIGYFSPTYKDLHEVWVQCKQAFKDVILEKSESLKYLILITGTKVDFWSLEDPDSGRGRRYHRVIVDECEKAAKFQEAWQQTIRATLADFKGDAYFFSTPQIGLTYFKEICKNQNSFHDWITFVFPSTANPHIDPEEIEQARLLLPDAIFRTEYLAEDIDAIAVNPFAHQWKPEKHESKRAVFQPGKQLIIITDFNLNPFAANFAHRWIDKDGDHCHTVDEMQIKNGSVPEMIDRVAERYGRQLHSAVLTGDAMGNRGEITQRDNASIFDQLLRGWNMSRTQLRVSGNPTHENSRADTNFVLFHHPDYIINPETCPATCRDMRAVQCDAFGQIIKRNRNDLNQQADLLDCQRMLVHNCLKDFIRGHSTYKKSSLSLR